MATTLMTLLSDQLCEPLQTDPRKVDAEKYKNEKFIERDNGEQRLREADLIDAITN